MFSSTLRPHFTPWKDPITILQEAGWAPGPVWTGGKSRPHRDSIPDLPTCSQSLYRLSYPAQYTHTHTYMYIFTYIYTYMCQSQWPRGLKRRSTAACMLRLWVRIPPGGWMSVFCECCVLSGRGLCDELITRPEESYRL